MNIVGYNKTKKFTCEKPFTLTLDMQTALQLPPSRRQSQHIHALADSVAGEAFFEGFSTAGINYVCKHMYLHTVRLPYPHDRTLPRVGALPSEWIGVATVSETKRR
jgi:hypothetical protein